MRRFRYRPGNGPRLNLPRIDLPRIELPRLPLGRRTRRRRYRVVDRRRFLIAQAVLGLVVIGALGLAGSVIFRSLRTARLNRSLAAMHGVAGDSLDIEIAAPPLGQTAAPARSRAAAFGELSAMVMPDGSPIAVPAAQTAAEVPTEAVPAAFRRTDLDILPDMIDLTRRNPDTVGWLGISGTVHLPVVYRDNTFYLDHDFDGQKNASGALFLDEGSPMAADTQNLLIHGHAMNDGSMFGILTHYRKLDYMQQHSLISFSTLWEKETYAVFAVLLVASQPGDPNYFNYFAYPTFASGAAFEDYIGQLRARSKFEIPVNVQPSDALLTLSTCLDDDRLVVVARRLRDDETKDEILSATEGAYEK